MSLSGLKCQNKVDNAPKNGPNLMYDSLLEAYGHAVWFSNKFFFAPQFSLLPGGKTPQKCPFLSKKCQKNVKKVDSAPKNGPNLMYDSLLEAYGHVVWFSEKKNFAP